MICLSHAKGKEGEHQQRTQSPGDRTRAAGPHANKRKKESRERQAPAGRARARADLRRMSCLRMTRVMRLSCRISRLTFRGRSLESTTPLTKER